jgi:hypothetical protein
VSLEAQKEVCAMVCYARRFRAVVKLLYLMCIKADPGSGVA